MSERGSGKSRKSPASKAPASKQMASKPASPKRATAAQKKSGASASNKSQVPARRAAVEGPPVLDPRALLARVANLESERDRLRTELEKAQSRIRALEESRDQVLNRIDWVIDSLKNLIETGQ